MPAKNLTSALFALALLTCADTASSKVVTLLDNVPVATGTIALPVVRTEGFRNVTMFGLTTGPVAQASFSCRFILDATGDPNTSPGVSAFSALLGGNTVTYVPITASGAGALPPTPVLGRRMTCILNCRDCGNVTMKALLRK